MIKTPDPERLAGLKSEDYVGKEFVTKVSTIYRVSFDEEGNPTITSDIQTEPVQEIRYGHRTTPIGVIARVDAHVLGVLSDYVRNEALVDAKITLQIGDNS